jgi:HEAT repeat protein
MTRLAFLNILACVAMAVLLPGCNKGGENAPTSNAGLSTQLEALKNPDKDTRVNALVEIAKMKEGAAGAVPQLIEQLKDGDAEVRRLAAYALMEIGPQAKAALPQLNSMMQDADRSVVTQVINSIRAIDQSQTKDLDLQKVKDMQ